MASALSSSHLSQYLNGIDKSFYKNCIDICTSSQSGRLDNTVIREFFWKNDEDREKPHESILLSCSFLVLQGSVFKTLCLGRDGKMHPSNINLNDHYGNSNGSFVSDDNHFYHTSRSLSLQVSSTSALLSAELRNWKGKYQHAEVDLSICIVNDNGRLKFVKHDGWFGRDGFFVKLLEPVPFVGFVVAGIQWAAGNEDHALRALAYCANSTIVCLGITVGACIGGPLGGVIGAGLATPIAILVETQIAGHFIDDPRLKAQFEEATIGRYLYETIRNMITTGAAAALTGMVASLSDEVFEAVFSQVIAALGKWVTVKLTNTATPWFLKKLFNALREDFIPQEWLDAEEKVKEKTVSKELHILCPICGQIHLPGSIGCRNGGLGRRIGYD